MKIIRQLFDTSFCEEVSSFRNTEFSCQLVLYFYSIQNGGALCYHIFALLLRDFFNFGAL